MSVNNNIAVQDQDPTFIAKMKSGYACIGNTQFLPGYCVLFAYSQASSLNDLAAQDRADFLLDMGLLGDAILKVYQPTRINYGLLSNSHPVVHAHLFPRYMWETEERRKRNVWQYPEEYWTDEKYAFDENNHGEMKGQIASVLQDLMRGAYGNVS